MAKLTTMSQEELEQMYKMHQMRIEQDIATEQLKASRAAEEALHKVELDFISSALQGILSNPELVKNLQEESKMEMVPLLANKLGRATAKKFTEAGKAL
jgi:hypothetical protein